MTKTPTEEAVRLLIRSMIAESLLSSRPDGAETEDGTIEMACCVIDVATLAADVWGAVKPELSRLQAENSELRLAICGGEDAPGYADSLPLKTIRDVAAENLRSWRDASDRAARLQAERDRAVDKIDGLESDLSAAVEVAYRRGAHEWVRLNYPRDYERLSTLPPPVKEAEPEPEPVAWISGYLLEMLCRNRDHMRALVRAGRDANHDTPLYATPPALQARVEALEKENAELKSTVIAFCAPWAVRYAQDHGLPEGHLSPGHYDLLERCGARMDDFTRAALTGEKEGEADGR